MNADNIIAEDTKTEDTSAPETEAAPAQTTAEAPVEELKEYDLGPLGIKKMTEKDHAAFVAQFLGSAETKAAIAKNKIQVGETDAEKEAKRAQEQLVIDTENKRVCIAAGLVKVPDILKKLHSVVKAGGQTDVYANFEFPGASRSSYIGTYVPKGKKTDAEVAAETEQAKIEIALAVQAISDKFVVAETEAPKA